jgi:hypothetical protein
VQQALNLYQTIKNDEKNFDSEMIARLGQGWGAEKALSILILPLLFQDDFRRDVLFSVKHRSDGDRSHHNAHIWFDN